MVHYTALQDADGLNILNTYFALDGGSLSPILKPNGLFSAGLQCDLQFKQNDSLVLRDVFRMLTTEEDDSIKLKNTFFHQAKYALPNGEYQLTLDLFDIQKPDNIQSINAVVFVEAENDSIYLAEPIIYQKNASGTLEPILPIGDYLIKKEQNNLVFYAEIYNSNKFDQNSKLICKYYLSDRNGSALNNYGGFSRKDVSDVVSISAAFNIENLPRGSYSLNLDVLDQKGRIKSARKVFFYRLSDIEPEIKFNLDPNIQAAAWLPNAEKADSLRILIDMLYPISDPNHRDQQGRMLNNGTAEQMRQYLTAFWIGKDAASPQTAYQNYLNEVRKIDGLYSTQALPGYKTDRGRVFLQYGAPDMVEDRRYEPSTYPYEIWQYNRLQSPSTVDQVNKVFIFANTESAGNLYRLIHSNANGENFNSRWAIMLNRRVLPTMELDDNGSDIMQHGGRVNSNMIINDASMDRINRR